METLDEKTQLLAVEKVLEEMQKAEEFLAGWNASWGEQCLDAYSEELSHLFMMVVDDIEKKYHEHYKLEDVFDRESDIGVPLRRVVLDDAYGKQYQCEFGRIDWVGMNSNKSERFFSFKNNGDIYFSKTSKKSQTPTYPQKILYDASYNVLSSDFSINITLDELIEYRQGKYGLHNFDKISFSLNGNILTRRWNDIEIVQDLSTGMKTVRIVKKYDKHNRELNTDINFEATLNANDSLEKGSIEIHTHKRNGKVNGTYRFDASRQKGVRANFYSRKGSIKIDLTTNLMLLGTANKLLSTSSNQNNGDVVVSNFANSTQNVITKNSDDSTKNEIAENLPQRVISFDASDFNMEAVRQAETRVIEMVKCIKGELPLTGLVERINNCLEQIDKLHNREITGNQKILKIESKEE